MRALVKYGRQNGDVEVRDVPEPSKAGPDQVLIEVKAAGVCGSDIHMWREQQSWAVKLPLVLGHEFCGVVADVGSNVNGFQTGQRVACETAASVCGQCVYCLSGNYNLCPNRLGYGALADGAFTSYVLARPQILHHIPDNVPFEHAALTEPMSVGRHAVARAEVKVGQSALVIGAGPVGLAVVAELRRLGVEHVVVSDYSVRRRAVALAMGATVAADPASEDPIEVWRAAGGREPLVVFDAVGVPGTLTAAMRAAPAFSKVCVVGSCMEADTIRPLLPQTKQLTIVFSFAYDPFEFADTLRAIAEGEIDVAPMITGVCGVDGVPAAFEALGRPEEHVKILVEPGGPVTPTPV